MITSSLLFKEAVSSTHFSDALTMLLQVEHLSQDDNDLDLKFSLVSTESMNSVLPFWLVILSKMVLRVHS